MTRRKHRITKKDKRLSRRIVMGAMIIACGVFLVGVFRVALANYEGLGEKLPVASAPYSASGYYTENGLKKYEDSRYRSLSGVDVSMHQGHIDWDEVKKQGVDFAMIRVGYRATESGKIVKDKRFKENLKGAKKAGLKVGVYFFSQANRVEEAVEEANYIMRKIRGKGIDMPVAFDMEKTSGDRISDLSRKEKTEIADAFCTVVRRNGYTPMIYGNPKWMLTKINLGYLTRYPLWLAHYTDVSAYPFDYSMWQYTDQGKVKGIKKKTDLDIYYIKK